MIFNKITKFIYNNYNLVLDENQKEKLQNLIKKYPEEQIKKAFNNYNKITKQFVFDEIVKKEIFEKYLDYEKKEILPDYLDQLSNEAKKNLFDCHDEIMFKCCGIVGKRYELLIEKLFKFFTIDKIPFWCIGDVLYHDILKNTPVKPIKIITEMGKKDNFINLCRKQYKRVQEFKLKFIPNLNKNLKHIENNLTITVGKELNNDSFHEKRKKFFHENNIEIQKGTA
jgi:hypothetical protein